MTTRKSTDYKLTAYKYGKLRRIYKSHFKMGV